MLIKKHEFVCGTTQSGKTFYSIERGKEHPGGVFFYNPQWVENPFTNVNSKYRYDQIEDFLKSGGKIDYSPIVNSKIAKEELEYLVQQLLDSHIQGRLKDTLIIIDECQIYARSGASYNPVEDIATRGLGKGLYGLFITQRPALTSNTLFTQAEIKTYFRLEEEEWEYFRKSGIDMKAIQWQIKAAGNYSYMQKINGEWTKPLRK